MGESLIVRRGGKGSEETAAPTITIISETQTDVTFTLTNNDDSTALITHEVDDQIGGVELAAAATSANITVALAGGTYTLTAFATVVGEVATQSTAAVEIVVIPYFQLLNDSGSLTSSNSFSITNLNLIPGKSYYLYIYTALASSSDGRVNLQFNGQNSDGQYHCHINTFDGTSNSVSNFNYIYFSYTNGASQNGMSVVKLTVNDNGPIGVVMLGNPEMIGQGTGARMWDTYGWSQFNVTSVNEVRVAARTGTFGAGSRIQIYEVID